MIFRIDKKTDNYVVLDKRFLNDKNLSWQAKGMLTYMLSLPNDWKFSLSDLKNRSRNGRDATDAIIKELQQAKYIRKEQKRKSGGQFGNSSFIVYETPFTENPLTDNPITENPITENPTLLNNKELSNKKLSNKSNSHHKQVYDDASDEMILVDFFIKMIRKNSPTFKTPNKQNWADTFRKMIQIDGRDKKEISKVILFVQNDSFEKSNVLSPIKLRKRYDSLLIKTNEQQKKSQPQQIKTTAPVTRPAIDLNAGEE